MELKRGMEKERMKLYWFLFGSNSENLIFKFPKKKKISHRYSTKNKGKRGNETNEYTELCHMDEGQISKQWYVMMLKMNSANFLS